MFYNNIRFRGDLRKWELKNVINLEDFGFYRTLSGERVINIDGWADQFKKRTIADLDNIDDLKKLKNIVLIKGLEPELFELNKNIPKLSAVSYPQKQEMR